MKILELISGPDGRLAEAKLWAHIGKIAAVFIIFKHSAELVQNWDVLLVLLGFIVAPDMVKKWLSLRAGVQSNSEGK